MLEKKLKPNQFNRVFVDLSFTLLTLYSVKYLLLQVESMWTFAGPISLLAALAVATWRLKINNESWVTLGLFDVGKKSTLIMWVFIALGTTIITGVLLNILVTAVLDNAAFATDSASNEIMQNRFINVPGNLPVYIYWLMVSWGIGAFTEELLFRGFLLLRFEKLFSKLPLSIFFAIIIQAVLFGQLHMYYQGIEGLVVGGFFAVVSAVIFISCQRRLWPLIISHGLNNSIGMTLLFLSKN